MLVNVSWRGIRSEDAEIVKDMDIIRRDVTRSRQMRQDRKKMKSILKTITREGKLKEEVQLEAEEKKKLIMFDQESDTQKNAEELRIKRLFTGETTHK